MRENLLVVTRSRAHAVTGGAGALVGAQGWTPSDYRALVDVANRLRIRPADLMLVMYSESRLNPHAYNPNPPTAYGLIQLTPGGSGMSIAQLEEFRSRTPTGQMPTIESYFKKYGKSFFGDAGEIYAYIFLPARANARGVADSAVLTTDPEGYYTSNRILDANKDGRITVGDLRNTLRTLSQQDGYRSALADLKSAVPGTEDPVLEHRTAPPGVTPQKPATPIVRYAAAGAGLGAVLALAGVAFVLTR